MEFNSSTGAKIMIAPAPWKDAMHLKSVIVGSSIPLNQIPFNAKDIKDFLSKFITFLDASDSFQNAIWPCLIRCTREDQKVTKETFDSIEARKDYYEIVEACTEVNLGPLLDRIFSPFIAKAMLPSSDENTQKSL